MEHPFLDVQQISEMDIADIQSKISDIMKRLTFAMGTGNVQHSSQLQMMLDSYNEGLRIHVENSTKGSDSHGDKIDIT